MISTLYKHIAVALKTVENCPIYIEDVPQNFKQPSFFVSFVEQSPSRGINGKFKNSIIVDVSYFPPEKGEKNEACWLMGERLQREFIIKDFKVKNRNLKIVDDVLHFMFDVDYRETLEDTTKKMNDMVQSANIQEV